MIDPNLVQIKDLIDQVKKDKLGWGIKFTKKNGCCFACKDGKTPIKYVVGKISEVKNADISSEECNDGIHLGKDFIGAGNYNVPERIYFCTFNKKELYGKGIDKWRVSKCLVVKELPLWLGYGPNGKKVLAKLGKKISKAQIAKYNPYQATKLPSLETIKRSGLDQVWDQVGDQVWNQVWDQVGDQVRDQVWNQVWNQVWDQVRATSYWAVNIHFDLGITHWFGDFLKLGVMIIFVQGKIKVFGKKGKFLGEYNQKDLK